MTFAGRVCVTTGVLLAFSIFGASAPEAKQADFDEYNRLLEETQSAHQAIADAGDTPPNELLERAIESDTALIEWIEGYASTDGFQRLGAGDQAALTDSLHVASYLRATARTALGECEQSRDELAALLEHSDLSGELRPRVESAGDDAAACLSRPAVASLAIDCEPADAEVAIDGVPVGVASEVYEVEPGRHIITLSAPGYRPEELAIDVAGDQQTVALGPIALEHVREVPVDQASGSLWPPTWYEWTLWGAGVVFIAVGAGFWANARDIEDQAQRANNGVVDPVNQDAIDSEETRAIVLWTLGIASIAAGTVLFFVLDNNEWTPEAGSVSLRAGGVTFWF